MKVVTLNCGSSSIKYGVYSAGDCGLIASGLLEKIGSAESRLRQKRLTKEGTFETRETSGQVANHWEGFEFIMKMNADDRIIKNDSELFGIGHRVVHGGELFSKPTLIDDGVIAAIQKLIPLAPLHNPHNLLGIEVSFKRSPEVPQGAVFDTAFHQTISVGSITGTGTLHASQTQVTSTITIPAGAATGPQTVTVVFPGPPGNPQAQESFTLANGFTILP